MSYLLAIGWVWFAGALGVGLIVGFATTTRAAKAEFAGRWVIWVFVLALGALGAASSLAVAPGRDGLLLDIALLAGLAYFLGLPTGGAIKSLAPAPARAPAVKQPPQVVVRGAPTTAPRPEPRAPTATATAPASKQTTIAASPPAPAKGPDPQKTAPVVATRKALPGAQPASLPSPRDGAPHDLTKIKGIGPKSVVKLHALGVFHYDQIAAWNLDNARWISATINAPGRVERFKWIQQARDLVVAAAKGDPAKVDAPQ